MSDEYTPGPWITYNAGADQNGTPVLTLTSLHCGPACVHNGVWIADIRSYYRDDAEGGQGIMSLREARANARLIATAPDLLVICREALAEMEDSIKAGDDPEDYPPASLIARMKNVIAKAAGLPTIPA